MTCVHTGLQHNAHPLNEGTAHRLCKKRNTHRILRNLNCDENTDFKDLTAKEVKEEIFLTLAQPSLTLEMLSRHSYDKTLQIFSNLVYNIVHSGPGLSFTKMIRKNLYIRQGIPSSTTSASGSPKSSRGNHSTLILDLLSDCCESKHLQRKERSTEVLTEEAGALGGLAGLPVGRGDSEGAAPEVGR